MYIYISNNRVYYLLVYISQTTHVWPHSWAEESGLHTRYLYSRGERSPTAQKEAMELHRGWPLAILSAHSPV